MKRSRFFWVGLLAFCLGTNVMAMEDAMQHIDGQETSGDNSVASSSEQMVQQTPADKIDTLLSKVTPKSCLVQLILTSQKQDEWPALVDAAIQKDVIKSDDIHWIADYYGKYPKDEPAKIMFDTVVVNQLKGERKGAMLELFKKPDVDLPKDAILYRGYDSNRKASLLGNAVERNRMNVVEAIITNLPFSDVSDLLFTQNSVTFTSGSSKEETNSALFTSWNRYDEMYLKVGSAKPQYLSTLKLVADCLSKDDQVANASVPFELGAAFGQLFRHEKITFEQLLLLSPKIALPQQQEQQ